MLKGFSIICCFLSMSALFSCHENTNSIIIVSTNNYYLNSNGGNDDNDGRSANAAWKSLKNLNGRKFLPGDSILFAKGSDFHGGFSVSSSGEPGKQVVFSTYGSGDNPTFTNPDYSVLNGNVIQVHGSYIAINGLHFQKCANSPTKVDKQVLSVGAIYGITGSDHLTLSNNEFEDCPIGVYINGQYCIVTNNKFRDCNRFLSEPDWGPIGIVIGNAYNDVSYNHCTNYVKVGGTFGADGGFIEFEDRFFGNKVHHVNVHHNTSIANQGFLEIEQKVTGDSLNVYYNFSDDYQQFIFYWGGNHSKVENNTVIRTRPSNHGSVNTVFTMKNPDFTLKNNIFLIANGIQVLSTAPYNVGNYGKVIHENNLYFCTDASTADPCGKPLGSGEKIIDPKFKDIKNGDYHLDAQSPAIKSGQRIGYTVDIENKIVPKNENPDIGAYQFQ